MNPITLVMRLFGLDEKVARLALWGALVGVLVIAAGAHAVSAIWAREAAVSAAKVEGIEIGKAAEREVWQTAANAERIRQAAANAMAREAADAALVAAKKERDDLAQALEDVTHAADTDPDRDRPCLSDDRLRQINRLR